MKRFTTFIDPLPEHKYSNNFLDKNEIHSSFSLRNASELKYITKRNTIGIQEESPDSSPISTKKLTNSNSPQSPLRYSRTRASMMAMNPQMSFSIRAEQKKTNSTDNQEIMEMMKKSIAEVKILDGFLEKMELLHKEELIKSLISGKFTFSQLVDVGHIFVKWKKM
jgi:hypothetical protein